MLWKYSAAVLPYCRYSTTVQFVQGIMYSTTMQFVQYDSSAVCTVQYVQQYSATSVTSINAYLS